MTRIDSIQPSTIYPSNTIQPSLTRTPSAVDTFSAAEVNPSDAIGVESRRSRVVLEFQASKPAFKLNWFPANDATPQGPDGRYNMTGPGSCCRAYDAAFGRNSEATESAVFRHPYGNASSAWFGHCDKAAIVAATMHKPQYPVTVNGVTFSPEQILGLMEEVADTMATVVETKGRRYNNAADNPFDVTPDLLISTLQEWTAGGLDFPLLMDKDQRSQVWNQAYDRGRVLESDVPFRGMSANLPRGPGVKFYQIELDATGVEDARRLYQAFIVRNSAGQPVQQGYIVGGGQHSSPDFLWRVAPVGDLLDINTWNRVPDRDQHNKAIMPLDVGTLYIASVTGQPVRT